MPTHIMPTQDQLDILKRLIEGEGRTPGDGRPDLPPWDRGDINLPDTRADDVPRDRDIPLAPPVRLDTNRWPEEASLPEGGDSDPSGRIALARLLGVDDMGGVGVGGARPPNDPRIASAILSGDPMRANIPRYAASARDDEARMLEDRIGNNMGLAMIPREGFVPGEPGRRYIDRSAAANVLTDSTRLGRVERDIRNDPFTGAAEQARVAGIRGSLDDAAMALRPETADVAKAVAERNAFAEYMKARGLKMAGYEADASPAAYAAGINKENIASSDEARRAAMLPIEVQGSRAAQELKDRDLERKGIEKMQPSLSPGMFPTGPGGTAGEIDPNTGVATDRMTGTVLDPRTGIRYTLPPNLKPLGAADEGAVKALKLASPLLGPLKSMLNPDQNQLSNSVAQHAKWFLYQMGVSPDAYMDANDPKEQARLQLASFIKIIAGSPYLNGSRNFQFIKQIQNHLTNPIATDRFLYNQINELERLWPEIHNTIIESHINPSAPLNFKDRFTPPSDAEIRAQQGR